MPSLEASIQMNDRMINSMQVMSQVVEVVISRFEIMRSVSATMIDTSSLAAAHNELSAVSSEMLRMQESIQTAQQEQEQLNSSFHAGGGAAGKLAAGLKGFAANHIADAAKAAIGFSDQMSQTKWKVNILNDGLQSTDELNKTIFDSAQRSKTPYMDTVNVVSKVGADAGQAFGSSGETVAFAEQLTKQFKLAGASTEEMNSGIAQIAKGMGAGALSGEDLNSVLGTAPSIVQSIADYMGVGTDQVMQMAEQGQLTADVMKGALFSAADETNKKFGEMPMTFSEMAGTVQNSALMAFQPLFNQLSQLANNEKFGSFVNGIITGIFIIAEVASKLIEILGSIGTFIYDNWSMIGPVVLGVAAAFGVFYIQSLLSAAATIAGTIAQWGLNVALSLCPVVWIILAIIALIAIFYLVIAVINQLAGTSFSATGLIMGAFFMMGAVAYNAFATIYNVFAAFIEFFMNVSNNTIYSVIRLFVKLAITVLDSLISMTKGVDKFATNMANGIIDAINIVLKAWNKFVDLLSIFGLADKLGLGRATEIKHTASITGDMEGLKGNLEGMLEAYKPDDYKTVKRMELKNVGATAGKGYAMGKDMLNLDKKDMRFDPTSLYKAQNPVDTSNGMGGPGDALNNIAGNTGDTAGSTGVMADSMTMAEEDLKYMRDIAERDIINRFTTAEIKVDMFNSNNISSDMDVDGVVDLLGLKIEERMAIAAEGVHM